MTLSFESIPYQRVLERIDKGEISTLELFRCYQQRLEQEEKNVHYSAKLSRIAIYEHEIKQSTCEKSLGYLKNYFLFNWKEQVKCQVDLDTKIVKTISEERLSRITELDVFKKAVSTCMKDCEIMTDHLNKAKKLYEKSQCDLKIAKDRLVLVEAVCLENEMNNDKKEEKAPNKGILRGMLSSTKQLWESTPEGERIKFREKVKRREKRVEDCLSNIAVRKRVLKERIEDTDNAIQSAINAFQSAEVNHHHHHHYYYYYHYYHYYYYYYYYYYRYYYRYYSQERAFSSDEPPQLYRPPDL